MEQDDAIIIDGIYEGPVQQWNEGCNRNVALQIGDVLSVVNGLHGIQSIIVQLRGPQINCGGPVQLRGSPVQLWASRRMLPGALVSEELGSFTFCLAEVRLRH